MFSEIEELIENFKSHLTLDGRNRVFNEGKKLSSEHIKERIDPEAFTREFILDIIFKKFGLIVYSEKHFKGSSGELRKVDYYLKNEKNHLFLVEAKPVNADLFEKKTGAVEQIVGLFKLAEVYNHYSFGIATDGLKWLFVDKYSKVIYSLDLLNENDFSLIKEILFGERIVSSEKIEEEISKRFYDWYNALMHGGSFKNHENKKMTIAEEDCLVINITVPSLESKLIIAQTIMDRLIFIKFLQTKGIIDSDILSYLTKLDENILNEKLKQLFFQVFNTEKNSSERRNVDSKFKNIPYLNGSLFTRNSHERKYPDYRIKAEILKEVIKFLDSFRFFYTEGLESARILDPDILGYIFEKAMTATERKGSGSYYTPKMITRYLAENTIYPCILEKTRSLLKKLEFKQHELPTEMVEIYDNLKGPTLTKIYNEIIQKVKICDNACGSGAFLLAAAEVMLNIYNQINDRLTLGTSEIGMRRLIIQNNIFGVDINPNAIEIAKLRLWLWIASSYESTDVHPLPNIEYNIRIGNSLIGYMDLQKFKEQKITLDDWFATEISVRLLLKERDDLVNNYRRIYGKKARELKEKIEDIEGKLKTILNSSLYTNFFDKGEISKEEFEHLKSFHWGLEFSDVFENTNNLSQKTSRGFDIIIGNPPYGNILDTLEKKCLREYETEKASEIAANFIERSLKILKHNGFLGLIVANSIAINKSTASVRSVIRKHMSSSKMALFNTRPARIFEDADIRVLIFIGKNDLPKDKGIIFTTEAIKFTKEQKDNILNNLEFESTEGITLGESKIGDDLQDFSLPKVGKPIIRKIFLKLKDMSMITLGNRIIEESKENMLEFRKTGRYWLNALKEMPYKSTKIVPLYFVSELERDYSILLINSSLFYLYWSTYGNLRDFSPSLLMKFPFPSSENLNLLKNEIHQLTSELTECLSSSFDPEKGSVGEFKTSICKRIIDKSYVLLGRLYNLSEEEIRFIINYDKHVRKPE